MNGYASVARQRVTGFSSRKLRKFRHALAKGSVGFTVLGYAVLCPSIDRALQVAPFLVHTFRATWHLQTMVQHNKTPKKRSLTSRAYRSL